MISNEKYNHSVITRSLYYPIWPYYPNIEHTYKVSELMFELVQYSTVQRTEHLVNIEEASINNALFILVRHSYIANSTRMQ